MISSEHLLSQQIRRNHLQQDQDVEEWQLIDYTGCLKKNRDYGILYILHYKGWLLKIRFQILI